MKKIQIPRLIFLMNLEIMKKILDLVAFKIGKKSDEYKYMKKEIMDAFYRNLKKLFKQLSDKKIIEKCSCKARLRQGYNKCKDCSGSGYRNISKKK